MATAEDGIGPWTKTTIDDFDRQASRIYTVSNAQTSLKKVRPLTAYIYESIPAAWPSYLPTLPMCVVNKRDKVLRFQVKTAVKYAQASRGSKRKKVVSNIPPATDLNSLSLSFTGAVQ